MSTNQAESLVITAPNLKEKNWSYAAAARHLRCTTTHLYLVANGRRVSALLTQKILALPKRDNMVMRERISTRARRSLSNK